MTSSGIELPTFRSSTVKTVVSTRSQLYEHLSIRPPRQLQEMGEKLLQISICFLVCKANRLLRLWYLLCVLLCNKLFDDYLATLVILLLFISNWEESEKPKMTTIVENLSNTHVFDSGRFGSPHTWPFSLPVQRNRSLWMHIPWTLYAATN